MLKFRYALYDHLNAVVFEAIYKNVSDNEIIVNSVEPLEGVKSRVRVLVLSECAKMSNKWGHVLRCRYDSHSSVHLIRNLNLTVKPREE